MASSHGCFGGSLDLVKYSSPVPFIGIYIAGASLLCMLIMLYDIIVGFRARKRWLPCKYFTLNSVTLTLLGVAAKLPVDLTTAMPRPVDQLSKLTGTTLICVAMSFLLPSLGTNSKSECLTNMAALSIFVITVVVNICIQIFTGVIALFIVEHILIICFMLLLLAILWHSSWDINRRKNFSTGLCKHQLRMRDGRLEENLRACYMFSFIYNPQILSYCHSNNYAVGGLCLLSSVVVIQAAFRSLILKQLEFCSGNSDYEWSMWLIVGNQILAVLVGCFAASLRWLTMCQYTNLDLTSGLRQDVIHDVISTHPLLGTMSNLNKSRRFLVYLCSLLILIPQLFFKLQLFGIHFVLYYFGFIGVKDDESEDPESELDNWKERKSLEDMNRWIVTCSSEPRDHLHRLLSRTFPSQQPRPMEIMDPDDPLCCIEVSPLSIVLLVQLAQVSLPDKLHGSIVHTFTEAKDVIHFIAKTIYCDGISNKKLMFSRAVWSGPGFSCFLPKIFSKVPKSDQLCQSDLSCAKYILSSLLPLMPIDYVSETLLSILEFMHYARRFSSIEDLYVFIEQLFVDMLHALLTPFPKAVFKSLNDSPNEEFEESVKVAMRFFCEMKPLADKIHWLFPSEWETPRFTGWSYAESE